MTMVRYWYADLMICLALLLESPLKISNLTFQTRMLFAKILQGEWGGFHIIIQCAWIKALLGCNKVCITERGEAIA